jgi:hypothetical protein
MTGKYDLDRLAKYCTDFGPDLRRQAEHAMSIYAEARWLAQQPQAAAKGAVTLLDDLVAARAVFDAAAAALAGQTGPALIASALLRQELGRISQTLELQGTATAPSAADVWAQITGEPWPADWEVPEPQSPNPAPRAGLILVDLHDLRLRHVAVATATKRALRRLKPGRGRRSAPELATFAKAMSEVFEAAGGKRGKLTVFITEAAAITGHPMTPDGVKNALR